MILEKLPFYREAFFHAKQYREAATEFYNKFYVGKTAEFNCEIISDSGRIVRKPGDKVLIREYDNCGLFRLSHMDGDDIYGLWKPDCLEIVTGEELTIKP
jgi:hypothetical protein